MSSPSSHPSSGPGNQPSQTTSSLSFFNLETLTRKLQTKLLLSNHLHSTTLIRFLFDATSERLFSNICRVLARYHASDRLAGQTTKRMLKMNLRVGLLSTLGQLGEAEVNRAYDYHEQCHTAADLVLRLGRHSHRILPGVRPSVEKLAEAIDKASQLALAIVGDRLAESTRAKFAETARLLADRRFLTTLFGVSSGEATGYEEIMEAVYDDMEDLMDRGLF